MILAQSSEIPFDSFQVHSYLLQFFENQDRIKESQSKAEGLP